MKRTLITGTNGFLANRLCYFLQRGSRYLSNKKYANGGDETIYKETVFGISRSDNHKKDNDCTTFYGDILDLEFLKRVISDNEITHIYHLAAQSIVRIANNNPRYCFEDNVMGTLNVLEAARQINPSIKIICASSDKSYGEHDTLPYMENFAMKAGDVYSTSKACGDLVAQSYHKSYGLNINIVRSANIYGAGDMNLSRIIPNTILRILKKEKPIIFSGVMGYKREFIYVDDVCEAYQVISEKGVPGEAYNVGAARESHVLTIGALVEKICELMEWKDGVEVIPKNFNEITTQYLCSKKLHELGWEENYPMTEGLRKTIEFYKNKFK